MGARISDINEEPTSADPDSGTEFDIITGEPRAVSDCPENPIEWALSKTGEEPTTTGSLCFE
jgi:hypothetical protein